MEIVVVLEFPSVTIACDEPSHRACTVAVFERAVADYGDGQPEPSWHWKSELATGGGKFDAATGERENERALEREMVKE